MPWIQQLLYQEVQTDSQPFDDLINDSTPFHWTHDHEKLFQSTKDRISEDTTLAVASIHYPFFFHVDSSNIVTGCILNQEFPEGKRKICINQRIFDKAEQKTSTYHREFCRVVSALKTLWTLHHWISRSYIPPFWSQTNSSPMGTQKTTIASVL